MISKSRTLWVILVLSFFPRCWKASGTEAFNSRLRPYHAGTHMECGKIKQEQEARSAKCCPIVVGSYGWKQINEMPELSSVLYPVAQQLRYWGDLGMVPQ